MWDVIPLKLPLMTNTTGFDCLSEALCGSTHHRYGPGCCIHVSPFAYTTHSTNPFPHPVIFGKYGRNIFVSLNQKVTKCGLLLSYVWRLRSLG